MKTRVGIVTEVKLQTGVVRLVRDTAGDGHYFYPLPPTGTRGVIVSAGARKIFYGEIQSIGSAPGRD